MKYTLTFSTKYDERLYTNAVKQKFGNETEPIDLCSRVSINQAK